jgi:hypothetical protein
MTRSNGSTALREWEDRWHVQYLDEDDPLRADIELARFMRRAIPELLGRVEEFHARLDDKTLSNKELLDIQHELMEYLELLWCAHEPHQQERLALKIAPMWREVREKQRRTFELASRVLARRGMVNGRE